VRAIEGEQSVIADRHAMGIAPEVPEDSVPSPKGRFGVDDPIGLKECVDEGVPRGAVPQVLAPSREIELVPVVRASKRLDKFPPKDPTEDLHG